MGGNALKEPSIRLGADKYHNLCPVIEGEVRKLGLFDKVRVVKSYSGKESFGDMDLLVSSPDGRWPEGFLESSFMTNREYVVNGPVCSLGWDLIEGRFQIDLILVPDEYFYAASGYYAYNDLGNLLGVIAKSLGFKLGHKGLWKKFYHPDNPTEVIFSVLVTNKWEDIFKFLKVPLHWVEKWHFDIDSKEDIFRLVSSSEYFHPDLYLLENRNSVSRVRDAKRTTYMDFLKWCETRPTTERREVSSEDVLQNAFSLFPEFKQRFGVENLAWVRRLEIKALLRGGRVSELTGLTGIELGEFMKLLKQVPPPERRTTFNDKEFIEGYILGLHSLWYKLSEVWVANQVANRLRNLDYSIVLFNPEELGECSTVGRDILEETLINKGWEIIDRYS